MRNNREKEKVAKKTRKNEERHFLRREKPCNKFMNTIDFLPLKNITTRRIYSFDYCLDLVYNEILDRTHQSSR